MYGYGFGTSVDVQMTSSTPLSPALRSALIAYNAAPTSDDARRQLLTVLSQAPLGIPADQVSTIEIKPALHTLYNRIEGSIIRVTLFKGGLLIIGEAL